MARAEIDPQLPYIQVHRGVGPRAAQLATLLGLSYQHVRGSLDVLWESLADRRILGRAILTAWGAGAVPALVLPETEVADRVRLAFGKDVELKPLVLVGFLEPAGPAFRVRGMSRYLEAEATRLRKAGKHPDGTEAPPGSNPDATGVAPRSDPGPTPVQPPSAAGCDPAKARGETLDVRGERQKATTTAAVATPVSAMGGTPLSAEAQRLLADRRAAPRVALTYEKPTTPEAQWLADDFWAWAQHIKQISGLVADRDKPPHLGTWWSQALMQPNVTVPALKAAFRLFGQSKHWEAEGFPFRGFVSQWTDYVNKEKARAAG